MTDFSNLPPPERAKRYRQLAEDARREANHTNGEVRESYRIIAEHWDQLAQNLEERIRRKDGR